MKARWSVASSEYGDEGTGDVDVLTPELEERVGEPSCKSGDLGGALLGTGRREVNEERGQEGEEVSSARRERREVRNWRRHRQTWMRATLIMEKTRA